jgi:ABC-type antimicrobial peptide transport system permease subunit
MLVGLLAVRQRHYEFSILRTLGASPRQLLGLIGMEGIAGLGIGLLAGTGIGYGLAVMMRPILSRVLSSAVGGDQIRRLVIDWPELLQWYGVFVIAFAITLLFLLLIISRSRVMRALKVSVE